MTGTMVSASTGAVNSLLGKLTTLMGEEYGKLKGIRKEVVSLEEEFRSMKALLEKLADMDELDAPAKEWRNQVKDICRMTLTTALMISCITLESMMQLTDL